MSKEKPLSEKIAKWKAWENGKEVSRVSKDIKVKYVAEAIDRLKEDLTYGFNRNLTKKEINLIIIIEKKIDEEFGDLK